MMNYRPTLRTGGLFLASLALLPFSAGAQAPSAAAIAPAAQNAVSRVDVTGDGNQVSVRVEGSGEGQSLSYQVSRLSDPPRVVVDLSDARLAVSRNAIPSAFEPIRGVRLGQSRPDQVRVVIDLTRPSEFAIAKTEHGLAVTFTNAGAASHADSATESSAVPAVAPAAPVKKLASAQTKAGQNSASNVLPLPALLTSPDAAMASPAQQLAQRPAAPQSAPSSQAPAASPASVSAPMTETSGPTQQAYSGEPISVNLKDVDLKDFFRLIHEISGLNVVLDPSVHGTVTLVLDEVPWDQALEIVLKNNGLDKQLDGNVLRIVTNDTLRKEADSRRDLVKAQADSVQPETVTRVLNYAKASELVAPLKKFLTARGDVVSIDRSNTLIIRDIPSSMPGIDNLIRQLDRKTQQVEIEARVVQASRSFARDIGTQFGMAGGWSNANSSNVLGGNPAGTASPLVQPTVPPLVATGATNQIPLLSNFPANAPTSGIVFGHASPNFALDYIITAAESKGVGKLLSSPQLVTQNNAVAIVKQGAQIPIQTTVNNTVSTTYIDAVLRLQVTPQITSEGTVFLDVTVENTQADFSQEVNGDPTLNTQSAQTKVLIADGGTVVIGGVMETQQNTTIQQVPLLGSVPVIGHLFSRTAVSVSTQELLFFLTPRILPD